MQAQTLRPFGASLLRPFGIDVFCLGKKFLVFNMVSRNIKVKYRRSVLGLFWTLLAPMAMAVMYWVVFEKILQIKIPHYLVFVLSGLLGWNFFSGTVMEGMESITGNWGLISKVPIPLQVFPYVCSITNLTTFALSLPVIVLAGVISGVHYGPSLLMVVFYSAVLFFLSYAFALIMAVAFVYLRDLRHAMGIFFQIWFYGTPVLYDESMIPHQFHWALFANPVGLVFADLHTIFVRGDWPSYKHSLFELGWVIAAALSSLWVQRRFAFGLIEKV